MKTPAKVCPAGVFYYGDVTPSRNILAGYMIFLLLFENWSKNLKSSSRIRETANRGVLLWARKLLLMNIRLKASRATQHRMRQRSYLW